MSLTLQYRAYILHSIIFYLALFNFFLVWPFPHTLHIFLFQHLTDDVSHRGDTSESLQSMIYVILCFLAMDGSGQQQFPTPKIRVRKSESLFFSNGTPLTGVSNKKWWQDVKNMATWLWYHSYRCPSSWTIMYCSHWYLVSCSKRKLSLLHHVLASLIKHYPCCKTSCCHDWLSPNINIWK